MNQSLLISQLLLLLLFFFYAPLLKLNSLLGPFRVLVGTGRACFETLRPLAYSLLAEIVHHVRGDLSLAQVLLF
jgi:prolipoprotein diacylglyceryltransferase